MVQELRTASPHFTRRRVSPGTHPYSHRKTDPSLPSGSQHAGTVQGSGRKTPQHRGCRRCPRLSSRAGAQRPRGKLFQGRERAQREQGKLPCPAPASSSALLLPFFAPSPPLLSLP